LDTLTLFLQTIIQLWRITTLTQILRRMTVNNKFTLIIYNNINFLADISDGSILLQHFYRLMNDALDHSNSDTAEAKGFVVLYKYRRFISDRLFQRVKKVLLEMNE